MKYLIYTIAILIFLNASLFGRLNDTKDELEKRLFNRNKGVAYRKSDVMPILRKRKVTYRKMFDYLPKTDIGHSLYFKTDKDEKVSFRDIKQAEADKKKKNDPDWVVPEEGWLLHAIFYKDKVIFESYIKLGESVNKFERDALFNINKGNKYWEEAVSETAETDVLSYNYETNDQSIRVNHVGSEMHFFTAKFSQGVQNAFKKARQEASKSNKASAPDSVSGF